MLKNFRLIAMVLVFAASSFGAFAQINETKNFKNVLLDGKPAKLNLVTGEITFTNGEIAKSRTAKKIKDSVLDTRTEIKTNLIKDIHVASQNEVVADSTKIAVEVLKDSAITTETSLTELNKNPSDVNDSKATNDVVSHTTIVSDHSVNNVVDETKSNPYDFHMVKKGETLYELSKRYETSLGQLKIANNLETTLIKEGETLKVRNFEPIEATEAVWVVSKGDTLYNIAKKNNTTVVELINLNGLTGNLIKIGQKLQVNQNSVITKK